MPKVTLDMSTFKALASDTRLDILRVLDGKKMSLKDMCKATKLNKATLHEHLSKLHEAGLVKRKEREGHKWVYYKLTWKGEGLLHPENTRIVVLFSVSFISVFLAFMLMTSFLQPITIGVAHTIGDTTYLYGLEGGIDTNSAEILSSPYDGEYIENGGVPTQVQIKSIPRGIETFTYLGSFNATDQSVEDATIFFQSNVNLQNIIGQVYDVDEFQWETVPEGRSVSPSELLLYNWSYKHVSFGDDLDNESEGKNETDDNTTKMGDSYGGDYVGFSPAIPEMVATVQDPTFLYLGVVFIAVFGALFTVSTWRLQKNKKSKL